SPADMPRWHHSPEPRQSVLRRWYWADRVFCQILLSHVCTRIEPRERLNMSHVCTLELSGTSSTIELLNVVWSWWLFHGCIGDSVGSSFESEHAAMMHCAVNDRSGHLLVSEYGAPA